MKKDKGDMSDIKNEIELQLLSDLDRISMRQWRRVIVHFHMNQINHINTRIIQALSPCNVTTHSLVECNAFEWIHFPDAIG